jgi:hypothetical protein
VRRGAETVLDVPDAEPTGVGWRHHPQGYRSGTEKIFIEGELVSLTPG